MADLMIREVAVADSEAIARLVSELGYLLVVVEEGQTSFGVYVPDLPGCVAAGETRDGGT